MESNQKPSLHQAIQQKLGLQNDSESTKLNTSAFKLIIPQLKIPQLNKGNPTPIDLAEQEKERQAVDARNKLLLNEMKRRRQISEGEKTAGQPFSGFVIPQLCVAPGEPQNMSSGALPKLERAVDRLHISGGDGGDTIPPLHPVPTAAPLIDLTTAVIKGNQNAPPKEYASKARLKRAQNTHTFDIPFIAYDPVKRFAPSICLLTDDKCSMSVDGSDLLAPEHHSVIGSLLDAVVGYPEPRKPQVKYAISLLEQQHLKMYRREDYGSNVKRFRFDTPSPDEVVKQALQKTWRSSKT
ncbi:GL20192 [Drosophila persimilis]|uniref:GL20192 n=1 Tax=Drosophila persimilis TaxID=7234 RepID=B4GXV8_DROPE|nr:GL20192 [Drosophila persimilis]